MPNAVADSAGAPEDCWWALERVERRRCLLALLDTDEQSVDPAWNEGSTGDPLLALRHVHLPKLAEMGLIEWDPDPGLVRRGPRYDRVRPLLELLREHEGDLPVRLA